MDLGRCHALGDGPGVGFTLVLGLYGRLRMPRGAISPWSGFSPAYVVPGELFRGVWPYATIHEELSILACRHPLADSLATLVQLDLRGFLPDVKETPHVLHVVVKRELGVVAAGGGTARRHHAVVTLCRGAAGAMHAGLRPGFWLCSRGQMRESFTVLDTLCLLWCVSRGTLSSRNCRHIRGSLSRHTLAPFPLRSRQVSTYHWPWRWYFCGVHCGRRPGVIPLFGHMGFTTPSLVLGVDTSSGAC